MTDPVRRTSAGYLLSLIRSGEARTRGELQELTGLSRSTVGQRLEALTSAGYLRVAGTAASTGGRPANRLEFDHRRGAVLVADLDVHSARVAVADLAGKPLGVRDLVVSIAAGPEPVLDAVLGAFADVLRESDVDSAAVRGVGVAVPGPVEFDTGRAVHPPIMPGWDGFPIGERIRRAYDVPVHVDNDANVMALGEQVSCYPDSPALVLVKVSTGIGAGVVVGGQVYRGIDGGAGDIGHVRLPGEDALCMCGSPGCLAAVASGGALARQLPDVRSSKDVADRIAAGDPTAVRLARAAGQRLGEVLATVICLLNPEVLVIAGELAEPQLVNGIRETLYRQALPRATRHLQVTLSQLREDAGIVGTAAMVLQQILSPAAVDRTLSGTFR